MFLLLQFGTLQTPDQKLEFTSTIIHNINSELVVVNQNVFQAVMQSLNFLNFLLKPESTVFCHIMSYLQKLSNVTVINLGSKPNRFVCVRTAETVHSIKLTVLWHITVVSKVTAIVLLSTMGRMTMCRKTFFFLAVPLRRGYLLINRVGCLTVFALLSSTPEIFLAISVSI